MKAGVALPFGDARVAANVARDAEEAGWDGFFVFEPVYGFDAWALLAAAAMTTERIRLGTMLSPLSRMRPWDLAGRAVTVDHLSGGRVILSVGLGAIDTGFSAFGEVTDRRVRAELLDEGLDIVTGLWSGQPFEYSGRHYRITPSTFIPPPPPIQRPRIPIWVVGAWPRPKSMRRVLRYDGLLPNVFDDRGKSRRLTPDDVSAMRDYVRQGHPEPDRFDIVIEGETPGHNRQAAAEEIGPLATAGMTWWLEASWARDPTEEHLRRFRERVRQGPPVP
jgi:alkanesulfonate monooxygenase SsuD/methylene tetrahydromethanopterin reductase-like flavin-dependent oxidoreductase (luciferase family)